MKKIFNFEEPDWDYLYWAWEVEKEWLQLTQKLSLRQLLEIFPEAKEVLPGKIKELEGQFADLAQIIKSKATFMESESVRKDKWFLLELLYINEGQELLRVKRHLKRLRGLSLQSTGRIPSGWVTPVMIETAKTVRIESVIDTPLKKSGKALIGLCPLHIEHTPSFYVYYETNTWHCYGCNRGGNIINLMQLLHGLKFPEAVKWLLKQ